MNARSNVAIAFLEGETGGSKDEKCGGEKGEENDRKAESDCISVIMWVGRSGCGVLINSANFSINATARLPAGGR